MVSGPRRRNDSAATRQALLRAAADLFAEKGFTATTVRDVAGRAGVNQALVFRYFGSKQELFAAVLGSDAELAASEPVDELPRRVLDALVGEEPDAEHHRLLAMLRSCGDADAAQLLRTEVGERYTARLAELSAEPDARLRADLVLAWFLGLGLLRSVLGAESLVRADPEVLERHVLRAVSALLERVEPPDDET
ncbi:TetR family transcriptional regulator [Saccharopolyspora sp. HNM0983]|uniref:TetR family transcriptional regulator n=1 Tax=Saccharopolyspora montiporae TaxID=2781240 RepID=A0A929B785_9PSEU|nr:TetR family transcriptional regulator [Saccharopolyspora sp. HNM0983]